MVVNGFLCYGRSVFCDSGVVMSKPKVKITSVEPVETDKDGTQWFSVEYLIEGVTKIEVLGFNNGTVFNSSGDKIR
jgi:hypothetical protein